MERLRYFIYLSHSVEVYSGYRTSTAFRYKVFAKMYITIYKFKDCAKCIQIPYMQTVTVLLHGLLVKVQCLLRTCMYRIRIRIKGINVQHIQKTTLNALA